MPLYTRSASLFAALLLSGLAAAQGVSLSSGTQPRFVDWSQDLDRPGVVVAVGALGPWKEGKRERLENGQLGGAGSVAQVSGTQYFKVPVTTTLQPRAVLDGKADKLALSFDVQIARLPDGKEQKQSTTGDGAKLDDGTLALFVLAPRSKGKGLDVLRVIPFDRSADKGADAEPQFVDTMRDFAAVNRRMRDLRLAIDAVDKAADPGGKQKALTALRELLDKKLELKQPANDGLLGQYVAPWERRAKERLDAAAKAEGGKGDEGK